MMELRIKEIRKARGLPQHRLGYVIDLPQSKISDIERGKRKLSLDEAIKLAEFLGVKVDDLVVEKS